MIAYHLASPFGSYFAPPIGSQFCLVVDNLGSSPTSRLGALLCHVGFALSFHLGTRCCESLCVSVGSSASPLVFCFGFLPFSWPSFLVLLVLPVILFT